MSAAELNGLASNISVGRRHLPAGEELIERVLRLVDERTKLMHAVAAWKWLHNSPVVDGSRENAVMEQVSREAIRHGLAGGPVRHVFKVQMRCARAVQEHLHERWRGHGFDHDPSVTGLKEDLRLRIDGLTRPLIRAMGRAVPALTGTNFMDVGSSSAARILGIDWSAAYQADLLVALAAVRSI
jgi:cyclohexadienyl dehydratase